MKIRDLSPEYAVSSQIHVKHVPALAGAGFVAIINNRPDGEMWGQPKGAAIEAAVMEAGLAYFNVPISLRGLDASQIDQIKEIQAEVNGKILAFCASGTRAANVWALTQGGVQTADDIIEAGMKAGYNLHGLRPYLGG